MANGFSKWLGLICLSVLSIQFSMAQNAVNVTALVHDIKDLSQRSSKVLDQNGERCALIRFETPIPSFFSFNLGAQQIEKRENKDDEVWIWVSADVKKMTIRCSECTPMKDYRVALKPGNVYRAKITTGLPQEVATTQNVNIYCEHTPFYISIDGAEPIQNAAHNYYTELPIGAHSLNVSAKLCKPYVTTIRVYRSRPYMDTIRLENNYGEIQINASQSSYTLFVDGEQQKYNKHVKAEPGKHQLVIAKDRYERFETTVDVKLNETTPVTATLKPAFSIFNVTAADEETEIWVDGKYRGRNKANIELVWGTHVIEGRRQGYDTWEFPTKDFTAESEKAIRIPKLNKQYGAIRLSVYPHQANVYLDGKQVTIMNGVYQEARAAVGPHFIQLRMTDYRPVRDSFTVVSGQQYTGDYVMEAIALGEANITTDPEIGIYRIAQGDEEPVFIGHTNYIGKLPAGENIIELKNLNGVTCQYKLFINDKQVHEPVTFPFTRKLMVRVNKVGGKIQLDNKDIRPLPIKSNKYLKMDPMKYELTINKRGYQPYRDTIDLSQPGVEKLVYRAELRRPGDTVSHKRYQSPRFLQRFYGNAGIWYIGLVDFGYTFDFNGGLAANNFRHWVTFGLLPLRYRMIGLSLADFELCVNEKKWKQTLYYKPKLSLVLPCNHGFAFTFYGGAAYSLHEKSTFVIGGASMRLNYVGKFPVDIFGEYKWPLKGVTMPENVHNVQLFRVGISFSAGFDL